VVRRSRLHLDTVAGAGLAATVAFAGVTLGLVILTPTLLGVWARIRGSRTGTNTCSNDGPVAVTISAPPPDTG
jgi:hypothetical protein